MRSKLQGVALAASDVATLLTKLVNEHQGLPAENSRLRQSMLAQGLDLAAALR